MLLFIKWVHCAWHFICTVSVLSVEIWNERKQHQYLLNFHDELAEVKIKWNLRGFPVLTDLVKAHEV